MDQFRVIKHPLDTFSFAGDMGELNHDGRNALDLIMLLIGDMKFRKERIEGTCARYFLLIDNSWVPKLCFLAHINCMAMREYLWQCELEKTYELDLTVNNSQAALHSPERNKTQDFPLAARLDYSTEIEREDFQMSSIMLESRPDLP